MAVNAIGTTGLTIQTIADIINDIEKGSLSFPGYLAIFPGANVQPNSPDANLINIFAQAKLDVLEFLQEIYDSFDPDQAIGPSLDNDCAINGVFRNQGTYTLQNVTIVTSGAVVLQGLDVYPTNPYTVSDPLGNQYQLLVTSSIGGAGTYVRGFQAALLGPIQSALNSITSQVTVVAGVTSVNNPSTYSSLGLAEETDAALRIRRSNSIQQASQGFIDGLYGSLIDLPGVVDVVIYENVTNTTDSYGIPGHSIWVIVLGGTPSAIANVINIHRGAGCGMMNSGSGAAGTATVTSTSVTAVTLSSGGAGYGNVPSVAFEGGGGTGAQGTAVLTSGVVTSVTITAGGSGYTGVPTVVFNPNTVVEDVTEADGSTFPIYYDTPIQQPLYIAAQVDALTGTVDLTYIATQLAAQLSYDIGQSADISSIIELIKQIEPNCYVTINNSTQGVSTTGISASWSAITSPNAVNYQFTVSVDNISLSS